MGMIEERYIVFNPLEAGGEVGFAVLRYDLATGMQGPREWVLDTLSGEAIQPGTYKLDFIDRQYVRTPEEAAARPARSITAPAFEGITADQGRVVNDRRPALYVVRDEERAASLHSMAGLDS